LIDDFFANNTGQHEFEATIKDIKDKWFGHNNQISMSYIRKVLKQEMKVQHLGVKKYHAFDRQGEISTGRPFLFQRIHDDYDNIENAGVVVESPGDAWWNRKKGEKDLPF
jgi:hypothetical protein